MHILIRLNKALRAEFPALSPTLTRAITRFVSGGRTHETFEEYSERITKDMNFDSEDEKNEFLFGFLLDLAKNVCQTTRLLELLKSSLSKSILEIKLQKAGKKPSDFAAQSSTIGLTTDNHSPTMFSAANKKRKLHDNAVHESGTSIKASSTQKYTPKH